MDEAARKPAKANIPSVDRVLATDAGRACIARFGQSAATGAVRDELAGLRARFDGAGATTPDAHALAAGRSRIPGAPRGAYLARRAISGTSGCSRASAFHSERASAR